PTIAFPISYSAMPFPVDPKYVAQAQSQLGVTFPSGYAARLVRNNGGELVVAEDTWYLHPVFDTTDRTPIKRTSNHVVRETMLARGWAGFQKGGIGIAANGAADCLVLMPSSLDDMRLQDAVYYWDHETGDLTTVADDFKELA